MFVLYNVSGEIYNLMMLHIHKDKTDELNMSGCLNEFVQGCEHRSHSFGRF